MSEAAITEATIAVMDQWTAAIAGESPLFHVGFPTLTGKGDQDAGVQLQEKALSGHLVLRGDKDSFSAAVEKVTGMVLPETLMSSSHGEQTLRWVSPDEWLLTLPADQAFGVETALRAEMSGHYAIVNVSGGQTILLLSGNDAVSVLMKSTPYDVHERNFPVGKVVTTVFAKTQALIRRCDEQQWELVIRRSFADYVWLWLQDACREYGMVIR